MIRFVDLRYQGVGARFAFWDTVRDRFEAFSGACAWATWEEFEDDLDLHYSEVNRSDRMGILDRHRRLCPLWVFEPPTDEELGFRDEGERFSGRCPTCGQACHGIAPGGSA